MPAHINTIATMHHSSTGTRIVVDAGSIAISVAVALAVIVAVAALVCVGIIVAVAVGSGVCVGIGVAVGRSVAVGCGVQVGNGVDVGGASAVSTARPVARACATTAVANSQPGALHCAAVGWLMSSHTRDTMNATHFFMMTLPPAKA